MFVIEKRLKKMIEKSYGKNPQEGWSFYDASNRIDKVKRYHEMIHKDEESKGVVDDITWNDLEMDNVFLRINHADSFIGEQFLYHRLHCMNYMSDDSRRKDFERKLAYYEENPEVRLSVESKLQYIGKMEEGYFLSEFLWNSELWKIGKTPIYHILQMLLTGSLLLGAITNNVLYLAGTICVALINLVIYLRIKQQYEIYFTSLIEFKKIYDFVKWIERKDTAEAIITSDVKEAVFKLRKMSWIIIGMNGRRQAAMTGDVIAILREYIWGILLIDVSMFNYIMKIISDKQGAVRCLMEFAGNTDSDIAVSSYRKSLNEWCRPEYITKGIKTKHVVHPLIKKPVPNDFILEDRAIFTGSNASGKSTFMKSMAINCILAQTINTCTATSFSLQPVMVITCMALRDDVLTGESYYYREAKCLKRMLDLISEDTKVLIVVDEILKGTNTIERIAASKAILEYIAKTECLVMVATHDNELTENLLYRNYHFCNVIEDNDIVFDYLIHEGRNTQSNAIELLAHLGYPKMIIETAKKNIK